jgi:hypothetical protein
VVERRHPPVTLTIFPQSIPSVRAAIHAALIELSSQLVRLQHGGYIRESWLGDDTSIAATGYYNSRVMAADDGPYAALVAYEAELLRIHDTLTRMEADYLRNEDDVAARLGRV